MKYLGDKVREYAELHPNKPAIECGATEVSYSQLEKASDIIANILLNSESEKKYVFVMLDKSAALVKSLLGIIKAGYIFVPIDINYPLNKVLKMMEVLSPDWIVTNEDCLNLVNEIERNYRPRFNVFLVEDKDSHAEASYDNHRYRIVRLSNHNDVTPEPNERYYNNKYCYIYFTSGTTGEPKAVLGRHNSLLQYIEWQIGEFDINDTCRVSQLTRPVFDPFLRDIFVPLCSGGTVCIPDNEIILNPRKLLGWIKASKISLIHMVPSLFKMLSAQLEEGMVLDHLKYVFLAGELLRGKDVEQWSRILENKVQLINLYGPTETTLAKFYYRIHEEDCKKGVIPVGLPITYAKAYILNKDMKKCPTGTIGEVYIRTPFCSAGYINDVALTKEKFIRNPYSDNPHDYIYKTGDFGKLLFDGNLMLLGRMDYQIKIRGMRIETGEIENVIMGYDAIQDVAILAKEDINGEKELYSYFVSNQKVDVTELKKFLSKKIPQHMVPAYYIQVDKLPLTANGKVNRNMLAEVKGTDNYSDKLLEQPTGQDEEVLLNIWKKILKRDEVGTNSDFFELGGHSLKVADLVGQIYQSLNVELRIADVFKNPTVKELADYIKNIRENPYSSIPKIEKREYYETSYAQKRMFILDKLGMGQTHYNTTKAFRIQGNLDKSKVELAINQIADRHEILRSTFELIDGEVVQKVTDQFNITINFSECKEMNLKGIVEKFVRPFDIEKLPLLRVELVSFRNDEHLLLLDVHHIITDGVSFRILLKEFFALYNNRELEELPIQYRDFCHWENNMFNTIAMRKQEEYWTEQFRTLPELLNMPLDKQRPEIRAYVGSSIKVEIPKESLKKIHELCSKYGMTLNMVLYCIFILNLHYYTGQTDITCGVIAANRNHPDLKELIGIFINFLPIRNIINKEMTISEFLKAGKDTQLDAYNNSQYPFDMIVNKVARNKAQNRNDLFDTMFVFHNQIDQDARFETAGLKFESVEIEKKTTKLDFQIDLALDGDENLICTLEYDTQLFEEHTMTNFLLDYKKMVENLPDNEFNTIQSLKLSSRHQNKADTGEIKDLRKKLINDFNDDLRNE
ncbi:amino acid adenylation domain-containing protein [Paenibacillus sp. M1]|uniref:Amino acid adenylation domain-containing protein n=1 Tax=Paenibacillus haidiansis TaxID=1574488 RepID=A0ABU7VPV2_9BACL